MRKGGIFPAFFIISDIYSGMDKYMFESDYGADYLKWNEFLNEKQIKPFLTSKDKDYSQLDSLQEDIILKKDPVLAYFFACDFKYKNYKMQKVVLDNPHPKYLCLFALNIHPSDIFALQNALLQTKNTKYICNFGCFIKNAEQKSIQDFIINKKDAKYAYQYLKHVKNCDVQRLKQVIFESKKPKFLFELSKFNLDYVEFDYVENEIIKSKSWMYIRLLAKHKQANVNKLEEAILECPDSKEIEKFARQIKKSKLRNFLLLR